MNYIIIPTLSFGGAEKIVKSILENSKNYKAICFFKTKDSYLNDRSVRYIVPFFPRGKFLKSISYCFVFFWILFFLIFRRNSYIQTHLHTTSIILYIAKKITLNNSIHDSVIHGRLSVEENKGELYFNLLIKAYKCSRNIICVSEGVVSEVNDFNLKNTLLIRNSMCNDIVYSSDGKLKNKLMFVGRLNKVKRLSDLIDALSLIKHNVCLDIYGVGPDEFLFKNKIKENGLYDRIKFLGFDKDVHKKYKYYDLLVSCSESETFSLTILEALVSGTPVLSSNCPYGPMEIVNVSKSKYQSIDKVFNSGRGALFYPVGEVGLLVDSINYYYDNEHDIIVDESYSKHLKNKYSLGEMVRLYDDLTL
ncbi:glycosyltransferase [Vibrio splendidus]|uniref:glycosyltransferase n=1 Tax=Vibrio splendidus TaxID=29497 RepID=UPI0011B75DF6|nr:glycosyltransferase [Vibrio splendidus]